MLLKSTTRTLGSSSTITLGAGIAELITFAAISLSIIVLSAVFCCFLVFCLQG